MQTRQVKNTEFEKTDIFKQLANAVPQLEWIARADGYIEWYNDSWYQYTGTKPEESTGSGWQLVQDQNLLPVIKQTWDASIQKGEAFEMILSMRGKDEMYREFMTSVIPWKDENGNILRWFGINTDISELKRIENELRVSEKLAQERSQELEKVLDSVPAAVWIAHDSKGVHISGNKYSYEWLNIPVGANASKSAPEGERPETFSILKDGKELKAEEMPVQLSARGKELRDFEFTIVYLDGTQRHVLGNSVPLRDEKGNPTGSVSSFMDITSRKMAEAALQESERRWATTLSSIGDAVIATDMGERITFLNPEAESMTGWLKEEAINQPLKNVFKIVNEKTGKEAVLQNSQYSNEKESILLIAKNGKGIPIDHKGSQIKTEEGHITGMVIVFRDITERRRSEELMNHYKRDLEETVKQRTAELEKAKERAESADHLKSAFLATMSHELRTPLNSIIGFSGIMMTEKTGPLNEEQKKQMGMVQASGRKLLSLINDILDLSKIEAGQLTIHVENFNLLEILQEIVKMETPNAQEKGITIFLKNREGLDLLSDRQRVQQIFLNLVNNAVKFTDQGSVNIQFFQDENQVRVEVADSGIGIEKENQEKLFSPFFQAGGSLSRKNKGTGLGLSICKSLVELLEGSISVKSELGRGSTFTVILPLKIEGFNWREGALYMPEI
jgi:PAS domain S-box-containing protein